MARIAYDSIRCDWLGDVVLALGFGVWDGAWERIDWEVDADGFVVGIQSHGSGSVMGIDYDDGLVDIATLERMAAVLGIA